MKRFFGALCALAIAVIAGATHARADDFDSTKIACSLKDGGVAITQLDSCRRMGGTPHSVCFRSDGQTRCGRTVAAPHVASSRPVSVYVAPPVQPLLFGPCYEPGFSGRVGSVWFVYRSGRRYCSGGYGGILSPYPYAPFGRPGGLYFYYRSGR